MEGNYVLPLMPTLNKEELRADSERRRLEVRKAAWRSWCQRLGVDPRATAVSFLSEPDAPIKIDAHYDTHDEET